jgi:hypothetical protein
MIWVLDIIPTGVFVLVGFGVCVVTIVVGATLAFPLGVLPAGSYWIH